MNNIFNIRPQLFETYVIITQGGTHMKEICRLHLFNSLFSLYLFQINSLRFQIDSLRVSGNCED